MAKLIVVLPGQPEVSHELTGNTISIGRLPDNDICIPDGSVSSHHARIARVSGEYRITDLDSMNKTWVRGVAVRDAPLSGEIPIRFGLIHCTFVEGKTRVQELEEEIAALKKQSAAVPVPAPKAAILSPAKQLEEQARQERLNKVELDELKTKLAAERAKVAELTAQAASTHDNQKQIATILSDTRKQLERAIAERDELGRKVAELGVRAGGAKTTGSDAGRADALEKERASLAASLAETRKQLEQAGVERDSLRKELGALNAKLEAEKAAGGDAAGKAQAFQKEQAQLAAALAEARKQLEQTSAERDSLRKQHGELTAKLGAETGAKSEVSSKAAAIEKQQAETAAALAATKKQLEAAIAERDALLKERGELASKLSAEAEAKNKASAVATNSEKQQAEAAAALAATKKHLDKAVAELEALRKENADISRRLEAEKSAQSAVTGKVEATEKEHARLTAELAAAKRQLDEASAEREAARKQNAGLAAQLEAGQAAAAQTASRAGAAEKERDELLRKLDEAGKKLAAESSKLAEAQKTLDAELQTAKADLSHARTELLHLKKEREEISESKLLAEQRIASLETEIVSLQSGAEAAIAQRTSALEAELHHLRQERQDLATRLDDELQRVTKLTAKSDQPGEEMNEITAKLQEAKAELLHWQSQEKEMTTELSTATNRNPEINTILTGLPRITAWLQRANQKRGTAPATGVKTAPPSAHQPSLSNGTKTQNIKTAPALPRDILHKTGTDAVTAMRGLIHQLVRQPGDGNLLRDFEEQARDLAEKFNGGADLVPVFHIANLLHVLSSELRATKRKVETRVLRSLIQGVDTLSLLLDGANRKRVISLTASQAILIGCDKRECAPLTQALSALGLDSSFEPELSGAASIKAGTTALVCIDGDNLGDDTRAICRSLKTALHANPVPALLITDTSPVTEWIHWSGSGVSDFLMKPVDPSELKLKALALIYRNAMGSK